ncbi:YD repeat-containing protein [Luteibacter sp. Sphag1AF]|uniref:IPT/TIG domain-containing protein n=1 Tax=Luteibacter sp. Sphag1AF TaxID=2587031 RepID=UPI00160A592E|nr:IPT/TIG domain-containing protein [Luteibacter sp. Sphag1AF]MBB3226232.1 YD repeat-containing protein [Luteibacter sp. Sphag1AF]
MLLFAAALPVARAQTYAYDGNGRVVAATLASGESVRYVYDDLGNLLQVVGVPGNQLTIFSLLPNHGSPGVPVTIQGRGFATPFSSNTVNFNGAPAPVTSGTATTLSVTVPAGAITGPVSVTANGQTVASDESFIVDGSGLPPVISSIAPTIVDVGSSVLVSGSHLAPVVGQTRVAINQQTIVTSALSDESIGFVAPASVGSGKVIVQTPFGVAISDSELVIPPANVKAANIGPVVRMAPGAPQSIVIPATKTGVFLFDGDSTAETQWISLQERALSGASSATYTVYDPRNRVVVAGTLSPAAPSIHLPKLIVPGTYGIYILAGTSQPLSITMAMEAAPTLMVDDANAVPAVGVVANESKRFVFRARPRIAAILPSILSSPTGGTVSVAVTDESGASMGSSSGTANAALNLPSLADGRIYQAIVKPASGYTENASIRISTQPGGVIAIDGPSVGISATAGVNATFNFTASAGDNLEFALSGIAMAGGRYTQANVSVYDSRNTYIAGTIFCTAINDGASCRVPLPNLAGGSYSITVASGDRGPMAFQATLTRDVTGSLVPGQPLVLSYGRPGQSGRLTFDASAGDTLALGLSNITTIPSAKAVQISVVRPDGVTLVDSTSFTAPGAVNLQNLPASGRYTVLVRQSYGLPMSLQLVLAPQAGGSLTVDGPSQQPAPIPGQVSYFTFSAAAADNLELAVTGITLRSGCSSATVSVYDSKNTYVGGGTANTGRLGVHLWALAGGGYSVVISNCMTSGSVTLTRNVTGSIDFGQTQSFNLTREGQALRLNFSGTSGQTLAVGATAFTTTPSATTVTTSVYAPDGTRLATSDVATAGLLNVRNLAASGTYTVVISPDNGAIASGQVSLLPQAGGKLVADGPSLSPAAGLGQNVYYTFDTSVGDNLELGFGALSMSTPSTGINYYVYNPSGSLLTSGSLDKSASAGASRVSLSGLAAATYSVVVSSYPGAASFTAAATLTRDVTGTLAFGNSLGVNLPRQGQVARLTFGGTAGQVVSINLSNYVSTPSGQGMAVSVYQPSGARIASTSMTSGKYTLPSLPVTGTYTVTLAPNNGVPATMTISLQ